MRRVATPAMLLGCLAATGALSSCGGNSPVANNQTTAARGPCLPGTGASQTAAAHQAEPAHVYIDRSQSMSGYVNPQLGRSQALADLLRLFERQLPTIASSVEYRAFGANIGEPRPLTELSLFSAPAAYNCRSCDNQESHIDAVLDQIARTPGNAMHLVVTDLWLDNRSFRGSDEVALGEPLRDILRSGRALGVVGIRAPFRGPIYDVPGVGTYQDAQERPLFLLMVGPPDSITQIYRRLAESESPVLAPERMRFSLYSAAAADPPLESGMATRGRGAAAARIIRAGNLGDVPQFRLALEHAERGAGAIEATFGLAPQAPSTVWQGDLVEQTRVWRLQSEEGLGECGPETWRQLLSFAGAWRPSGEPDRFRFSVDHRLGGRLPPGTYYLLAELGVRGLTVPSPQTNWMEEWSLSPGDAAAFVQQRPAAFKALNLGRFRTIMDEELQRQRASHTRLTRRTGFLLLVEP